MRLVVGVADMRASSNAEDLIVTHALGSCLGIVAYDPKRKIGGILHAMLPSSSVNEGKADRNPYMFVDKGVPEFFHHLYSLGAVKADLQVRVAGGAAIRGGDSDFFAIGKRNVVMLRKLFWKNGILIAGEDVGGTISRTLFLSVESGRSWIQSGGQEWEL